MASSTLEEICSVAGSRSRLPGSTRSLVFSLVVGGYLELGVLSKLSMLLLAIALGCALLGAHT